MIMLVKSICYIPHISLHNYHNPHQDGRIVDTYGYGHRTDNRRLCRIFYGRKIRSRLDLASYSFHQSWDRYDRTSECYHMEYDNRMSHRLSISNIK